MLATRLVARAICSGMVNPFPLADFLLPLGPAPFFFFALPLFCSFGLVFRFSDFCEVAEPFPNQPEPA